MADVELPDILTHADCEVLVRAFYSRAMQDPLIGFIFTDVAKLDLEAHVPVITRFWETILLGAGTYSGGAFRPHAVLNQRVPLLTGHFDRWVTLWCAAVDERFAGDHADLAKAHARRVARAFDRRLRGLPDEVVASTPLALGLSISLHGAGAGGLE